jgi:hypothetical protein
MTEFDRTSEDPDLLEFTRCYEGGDKVAMRGLRAASYVVKKYELKPDEAVAFSSWQGVRKAMTVFHFHPDFEQAAMRTYMENHEDGLLMLQEVRAERAKVGGAEWLNLVRGTGLVREIIQASLSAFTKTVASAVMATIQPLLGRPVISEMKPALVAPPPPPTPVLSGFELPTAKTFPVILWPKPQEPALPDLAAIARQTGAGMHGEPVSSAIH